MRKNKTNSSLDSAYKNLNLVMAESAITAGLLAMPIITPFFNSIGLSNQQISEVQIYFTIVVLLLNIPTGYIADRVSRKWANIIGDFGHGIVFLLYAQVASFTGAVICECICGVMAALSSGVDQSLVKHFVDKICHHTGESETKLLKTKTAKLEMYRQICSLALMLLGGPIGAISLRLAIALSAVSHIVGGIISIFIDDDSEKLVPVHKNPLKDIAHVTKNAALNRPLRVRILAYAVGREMTHATIWIATPLFLAVGVPLSIVSLAWVFKAIMCVVGARLAVHFGKKLSDSAIMAIPTILMTFSLLVMGIHLSIVTVWLYGLMGIVQGWTGALFFPMVQRYIKKSEQTSILSLTKTLAELLYIPAVWAVGHFSDIQLEYGLFTSVAIFLPLSLIIIKQLKQSV